MVVAMELDAQEPFSLCLEQIHGDALERELLALGSIGGEVLPSGFFSVTRPALSELDFLAREHLKIKMQEAGMTVEDHPLGLIGTYEGTESDLPSVLALSHFDSVPKGGMYDGCVGVIGAIESVKALHTMGIRPRRNIQVMALTGEESYRFNFALFGSRGIFHGLTERELEAKRPDDISLGDAIEAAGFTRQSVLAPRFTSEDIAAAVELHVIQDERLNDGQNAIAVVEAIAAPHRFEIAISPDNPVEPVSAPGDVYQINIAGKAGHSGATPMGSEYRADGLLAAGDMLRFCTLLNAYLKKQGVNSSVHIGGVTVDGQAMNKIPGQTAMQIKICGDAEARSVAHDLILSFIEKKNADLSGIERKFDQSPISMVSGQDTDGTFYDAAHMDALFQTSAKIIRKVNLSAVRYREHDVVGTVGTYNVQNGCIKLGVDMRGIDLESRENAVSEVISFVQSITTNQHSVKITELAGSGEPTVMNPDLVAIAEHSIVSNNIGPYMKTYSPAGHDMQNVVRAGIPGVMLFMPSRNDGAAHVPEEYSTPEDLEAGTKALAAMLYTLSAN